jgi:hypothetical protein
LKNRHPLEINRAVLDATKKMKIPDISTFEGEFRYRVRGQSVDFKEPPRNEHYEIKPDMMVIRSL